MHVFDVDESFGVGFHPNAELVHAIGSNLRIRVFGAEDKSSARSAMLRVRENYSRVQELVHVVLDLHLPLVAFLNPLLRIGKLGTFSALLGLSVALALSRTKVL